MTEDQFVEVVSVSIGGHVSRDETVTPADQEWEARNAARAISKGLRLFGLQVPVVSK